MKLVTYETAKQSRLGVVEGDFVVDVATAYSLIAKGRIADAKVAAAAKVLRKLGRPPEDMLELWRWEEDIARRSASSQRALRRPVRV